MKALPSFGLLCALATPVFVSSPIGAAESGATTWSGFGELHLNYTISKGEGDDPAPVLDFHRFVVGVDHSWSPVWSFAGELELEHTRVDGDAPASGTGSLALTRAFVQWSHCPSMALRAGIVPIPAGLSPLDQEPNRFLAVERVRYAQVVIPSSWYGSGIQLRRTLPAGFEWQATLAEGLDSRDFRTLDGIRQGRQLGHEASTATVLGGMRLEWSVAGAESGAPLVVVGSSWHRSQLLDNPDPATDSLQPYNSVQLTELHARYQGSALRATAEAAYLRYAPLQNEPGLLRSGWGGYVELGYDLLGCHRLAEERGPGAARQATALVPFVRYEQDDMAAQQSGGLEANQQRVGWVVGVNWSPIPAVSLKADAGIATTGLGLLARQSAQLNTGLGYSF
jgi:hypothetical protein